MTGLLTIKLELNIKILLVPVVHTHTGKAQVMCLKLLTWCVLAWVWLCKQTSKCDYPHISPIALHQYI